MAVELGPYWGQKSKLLVPESQLHSLVTGSLKELQGLGIAVDTARPPHIEVRKGRRA